MRTAGAEVVRLSAAERSELATRFSGVGGDWAKDLDARGKPGNEAVRAFGEALRSTRARVPPVPIQARPATGAAAPSRP